MAVFPLKVTKPAFTSIDKGVVSYCTIDCSDKIHIIVITKNAVLNNTLSFVEEENLILITQIHPDTLIEPTVEER